MKAKPIKLDVGTVYQKKAGGTYYYRYQINDRRKAVSLKTNDKDEAVKKAKTLMPITKAPAAEVVAAHVKVARGWANPGKELPIEEAWSVYDKHPDRAQPATVNVYLRYKSYFADFVDWARDRGHQFLHGVTDEVAADYCCVLKGMEISVDTHNKRVARISHIFRTLKDYTRDETSDWTNRNLRRRRREETGITARRLPFSREQEEELFAVLEDPKRRLMNKSEIRIMFYLGAFTGQRMKDCALLQWQKVDLVHQRIKVIQFKTEKEATIPIAPRLLEVLKEAEAQRNEDDVYVLPNVARRYLRKNANRKDVGAGLVNIDVMRVIRWIGVEPNAKVEGRRKAVSVYGFHSLRHSFVSFCNENNIPKAVVVSILGADSDIIDQYYTHIGDAAQEQAIQLINGNTMSARERNERALEFLGRLEYKTPDLVELKKILTG